MLVASGNIKKERERLIEKGFKRGFSYAENIYKETIEKLEQTIKEISEKKKV